MSETVTIRRLQLEDVSTECAARIADLASEMQPSTTPNPNPEWLRTVLSADTTYLLGAFDSEETILGMLTLCVCAIPTGWKAQVEDVVTDPLHQGKGIASRLFEEVFRLQHENGWSKIQLTSKPKRVEANRLYVKLGFELIETNVYRRPLQ